MVENDTAVSDPIPELAPCIDCGAPRGMADTCPSCGDTSTDAATRSDIFAAFGVTEDDIAALDATPFGQADLAARRDRAIAEGEVLAAIDRLGVGP